MSDQQLIGTLPDGVPDKFKQPQIHHAQALCNRLNATTVIILATDEEKGTFGLASYGDTVLSCKRAKRALEIIAKYVEQGEVFPDL